MIGDLYFASLNFKQGQFTEARRLFLKIKWPCFFLGFLKINFTDGLIDVAICKTKIQANISSINNQPWYQSGFYKLLTANIFHSRFVFPYQTPPPTPHFFNQKNDLESVLHWKMHQPSTKFPYATKMPKKSLMTEPRSISSRRSSLLSSANSFIQRSSGRGELLTGAPKTPKF